MSSAKFVDEKGIKVKGINIKGITNTWEFPAAYTPLQEILAPYMINYALGMNAGNVVNLKKMHDEYLNQLKQGEKADIIMMHKETKDHKFILLTIRTLCNARSSCQVPHKSVGLLYYWIRHKDGDLQFPLYRLLPL